ncbi:type II toxin-antitoxin system VapC family toxin [Pararhizobium sp. LjRoot238]|uniref:type II toxin-antitoxin system VapC family toxin n=1 Tax=Pararhizobium sp. LjRoot238 TaxID=3342293 RepID=UPI003ED13584
MSGAVFDASAILAMAFNEPGAEQAMMQLPGARISAVNYSEAGAKLIDKGLQPDEAFVWLGALRLEVVPFDTTSAEGAAALRKDTRARRLSFADRACIGLAIIGGTAAITTDRIWSELDLACVVKLIR